jgi:hypothetical protein
LSPIARRIAILDGTKGANLVALHEEAYEEIRARTGLPSRMATLALRDHSRRAVGEAPIDDIPLDSKLFSVKGPDSLSIATIGGRVVVPYVGRWLSRRLGRFLPKPVCAFNDHVDQTSSSASMPASIPRRSTTMSNEGILARLGRVIAGVVNNAVDAAEGANPTAIAQQAVREIEKIAEEARAALGVAIAAGHRLKAKAEDLDAEIRDLDAKIKTGLEKGREDLARAATGLQIDLEAQRERPRQGDRRECGGDRRGGRRPCAASPSARADAMKRLDDAKRAERAAPAAADALAAQRPAPRRCAGGCGAGDGRSRQARDRVRPRSRSSAGCSVEDAIEARLKAFREGQR